jgi:O-glycosyl hydrolase
MVNLRKLIKSGVAGLTAASMVAGMAAMLPEKYNENAEVTSVKAASTATVDLSKTYQYIRGFGGMNHPEWQSYNGGGDMKDSEIQTAFGNGANQLGLTILRIFVSDNSNEWKNAVPTAQKAQKLGATVFATPWNPPASMRHNGTGGANGGKYVLNDGAEGSYAQHLNSFVKYIEGQGINLYSVSVQNEPDYSMDWTAWSPDRTTNFIANYGQAVKQGTKAKLMSPESFQYGPESYGYGKNYYKKIIQNSKAMANCDLFGTHFYGTQRSGMDYPTVENSGKEIWMTEVYVPNSNANSANNWPEAVQVAENIHNGLVVGNMSAYVWWYIRRSYSLLTEDGKPSKRGYMMAQYSKWVRPGYRRTEVTEQPQNNILVSAYKGDSNKVVIVAVNKGSTEVNQAFSISGQTLKNVDRYRTTGQENLAATLGMSCSGGGFNAQLPANSVSTFVCTISGDHGTKSDGSSAAYVPEPLKPDANGYYYHDTFENGVGDWEARGSVKTEASGRTPYAGTEALVVSERTATWNGIQKTLDATTFKAGEKFAFSACVNFLDADVDTEDFSLTLQYKDSSGTAKYANIDTKTCTKENYVQLYNAEYQIPADAASDVALVIESVNETMNFYVDEVIIAKAGTAIDGPAEKPVVTTTVTEATTEATTTTVTTVTTPAETTTAATTTTVVEEPANTKGDANNDGSLNSTDLVQIIQHLVGKTELSGDGFKNADMNDDNKITILDLIMLKNVLA